MGKKYSPRRKYFNPCARLFFNSLLPFFPVCIDYEGVQAESDAGDAFRRHLAGGFHRRPGRGLLAHQGHHVRWRLDRCAVPLQVRPN